MGFCGILWDFEGFFFGRVGPDDFYWILSDFVGFCRILWVLNLFWFSGFCGILWVFVGFCGILRDLFRY